MIITANEVWDITHVRKGALTVHVLEPVDTVGDGFFKAEILVGVVEYASRSNRIEQRISGLGTEGDVITMRTSLTKWLQRRGDLEVSYPPKPYRKSRKVIIIANLELADGHDDQYAWDNAPDFLELALDADMTNENDPYRFTDCTLYFSFDDFEADRAKQVDHFDKAQLELWRAWP